MKKVILTCNKYNAIDKYCRKYAGYCDTCVLYNTMKEKGKYFTCNREILRYRTDSIMILYDALCRHFDMDEIELYHFLMDLK